jgi:predicted GNAT family acetyltransferase
MEIKLIEEGHKGYFKAVENNVEAGRMTYSWAGEDKFIIDHTEVNPDFSGKGIGKKLVTKAVEYAREKGVAILPLCPFAKSVMDKTPEMQDVLYGK